MPILIVDDDELSRVTLSATLAQLGHPLLQAVDGEAAWELLCGDASPVVCCCDVMMPRLDGVGLLQRAAKHPVLRHLPFILMSSAADASIVRAAADAGVHAYVLKPFLGLQTRATVGAVRAQELASRAEHFLATRRRLGVDLAEVRERQRQLQDALEAALFAGPGPDLWQRLADRAEELGLWRCRTMLVDGAAAPAAHADEILREVLRLVAERMDQIVRLAPAVPSGFAPLTGALA